MCPKAKRPMQKGVDISNMLLALGEEEERSKGDKTKKAGEIERGMLKRRKATESTRYSR